MKRVWWVARIAVPVAAMCCIFTPGGANGWADQSGGCDTSQTCARNSDRNCYCPDSHAAPSGAVRPASGSGTVK